ncbi:MAG: PAS domain S-box protein [Piscinibacter sp.]|nr:PAS domain S-box protein [Piscinibacter sp.]
MTELRDPAAATRGATRRLMWLLVVPVLLLLLVLTMLQLRQLRADAQAQLERRVDERAQELAELVRPAVEHVNDLRVLLETQWDEPPDSGPGLRAALQRRWVHGQPDGWSIDPATPAQRDRFGQVWWAPPDGSPPPEVWLRRAQAFVSQARVVHRRTPAFEATWFAGTDLNTSFGYPWIGTGRIVETLGVPSLTAIAPLRAQATQRSRQRLEARPFERSKWGPPYTSQLHGALVVSHSAYVFVRGEHVGEVSVDVRLDELQERIGRWSDAAARDWIVDEQHQVLADSAQPLTAPGGAGQGNRVVASALADRLPAGVGIAQVDAALRANGAALHHDGWVISAVARRDSPWAFVSVVPESTLTTRALPALLPNALIGLALLTMFVAGQWLVSRNFVDPALHVLAYLRALSQREDAPAPTLGARWQPWLDAVGETFRRQRELQRRERQQEAFKSAIVDNALAAIVATDAEGRIVEFNRAAEAMFGRTREAVLGQAVGDVIVPQRFRAGHEAGMQRMRTGQAPRLLGRRVEMMALRADGTEFPVEMVLWRTEAVGHAAHFTASMTDLSERRAAAQQIEQQREALRQSEKLGAMGSLLAGVAHELNNPLAIVMGRASLLEEKCVDAPALRADAQRIREAAERCGRIVRTFLNMARQKPPERRSVQLNDLARAATEMLAYTFRSHGVELQVELAADLPEVRADADQIGQVVLNLLVNAQQALAAQEPQAGAERRVRVSTGVEARRDNREPRVWLRVADSGPGIAAALREKIFEPFFTTKPEGLGTGLGLAVSRSLVREHGGELGLESSQGGAVFRLSLPISGERDAATEPGRLAPSEEATAARLLVVDDEPELADLMRAMLEGAGFEVATAESGAVALELLGEARFDAIVSDLRMPDMDGAGLWRAVRERQPALARRMLFVTGDTLSPGAEQFLAESRCGSLDKPFARDDLVGRVHELLAR